VDRRRCPLCDELKELSEFRIPPKPWDGIGKPCKICEKRIREQEKKAQKRRDRENHRNEDTLFRLWKSSKNRSCAKRKENTLKLSDIPNPSTCAYLDIPLDYRGVSEREKKAFNIPTLDRIDNTRGYTPDNIQVISDMANRMKSNATIPQLLTFGRNIIKKHGHQDQTHFLPFTFIA
jgi:hypothetical protein